MGRRRDIGDGASALVAWAQNVPAEAARREQKTHDWCAVLRLCEGGGRHIEQIWTDASLLKEDRDGVPRELEG